MVKGWRVVRDAWNDNHLMTSVENISTAPLLVLCLLPQRSFFKRCSIKATNVIVYRVWNKEMVLVVLQEKIYTIVLSKIRRRDAGYLSHKASRSPVVIVACDIDNTSNVQSNAMRNTCYPLQNAL
jgi:hypothetical protein